MTYVEFLDSIANKEKPVGLSIELEALWEENAGDWQIAHEIADSSSSTDAAWVHAYLHRVEGDEWNADYWYSRAGKTMPTHQSLSEEWESLVSYFLASSQ